jgi:cation transporter-like permease
MDNGPLRRPSTWVAVAAALAAVAVLIGLMAHFWADIGGSDISAAGWAAMILGVIVTLALGIGLMALVFISNRRGFDEPGRDER